jgi:hypothetical protein
MDVLHLRPNIKTVTKFSIYSCVVCGQFKGLGFKPQTLTPFTQLKCPFEVWVFFFSWFQPLNEVGLHNPSSPFCHNQIRSTDHRKKLPDVLVSKAIISLIAESEVLRF